MGGAQLEIKESYFREMRHRFPEFGLCNLNWKADFVVKKEYLWWFTKWQKRSALDSEGHFDSEEFPGDSSDTQKRLHVNSMKVVAKRLKRDMLVSCRSF